jgi:hypothetical protein
MIYAGIDLGINGGLAFIGEVAGSIPFGIQRPIYQHTGKRKELDVSNLRLQLASNAPSIVLELTVIVEELSYHQPSQAAMRSQALSYGKLVGMLETRCIKFIPVQAQKWQKEMLGKIPAGTTKRAALGLARRLWPSESFILPGCKVPSDGCVDAALLAEYGRRNNL